MSARVSFRAPMLVRALAVAALLSLGLYAVATYLRRANMFFPARYPEGDWEPRHYPVVPSDETFTTPDGLKLHGWLFHGGDTSQPIIVWFHGNAGNITDRAATAAGLAQRGVSVFLFDWRGYGRSEGKPAENALFTDALAAFDFVESLGYRNVIAYGESLGGPYAAYVAKERGSVHGVVIENSFPSLRLLGNALYAPFPLGWMAPFALDTTRWINDSGHPALVMHGRLDAMIPYALGVKLYDGLRVPKEMLTSNKAGHCEIPTLDEQRYYEAVTSFARRVAR